MRSALLALLFVAGVRDRVVAAEVTPAAALSAVAAHSTGEPAAEAAAVRPAWLSAVDADSRRIAERSLRVAAARDNELSRLDAEAHRPSLVLAAVAMLTLLAAALAWSTRWLVGQRAHRRTCHGLAIAIAPRSRESTGVICLSRSGRTASGVRDPRREAAVRDAAAEPDDPPTHPRVAQATKRRIAYKHETAVLRRQQRARERVVRPEAVSRA